jgi:vancomycin resistance protein YoaR
VGLLRRTRIFFITALFLSGCFLLVPRHARAVSADAASARARIKLKFQDYAVSYEDTLLPTPDHLVYEELYERRINAEHAEKVKKVEECLKFGASPKASMLYCYPLLEKKVDEFIKLVDCEPTDSRIRFRPYEAPMFTISKERVGYKVNEERLYYDVYNALKRGAAADVNVRVDVTEPARTADMWKACTYRRAAFSTGYESSNDNRKHNIKLALSKINGLEVADGAEFSFNQTVGSRTRQNGFVEAKIIRDGEYVEGTGGGVCQASTTVYNAALRADMQIVKANSHSLVPSYVPPSMDAMVNAGSSDFRFKNTSGMPVFIKAYGTDSRIHVEFYGLKMPYKIMTESVVISKTMPPPDKIKLDRAFEHVREDMPSGEQVRVSYGIQGLSSEGYALYYKDGKLIEKKLIRKDVYKPAAGIIAQRP